MRSRLGLPPLCTYVVELQSIAIALLNSSKLWNSLHSRNAENISFSYFLSVQNTEEKLASLSLSLGISLSSWQHHELWHPLLSYITTVANKKQKSTDSIGGKKMESSIIYFHTASKCMLSCVALVVTCTFTLSTIAGNKHNIITIYSASELSLPSFSHFTRCLLTVSSLTSR